MLERIYGLAPRARLEERDGRQWLVCDYPLRSFELNEAGWLLLRVLDGRTSLRGLVDPVTPEAVAFLEEKVAAGVLRAEYRVSPPAEWPTVEVIVPVYADAERLARCLRGLAAQSYPHGRLSVTVVDGASPEPAREALAGADLGGLKVRWLRLPENGGPASARNAGAGSAGGFTDLPEALPRNAPSLAFFPQQGAGLPGFFFGGADDSPPPLRESPPPEKPVRERGARGVHDPPRKGSAGAAPVLAFIDSDCVPEPDWLERLISVLEEPGIAAVAGRVLGFALDGLPGFAQEGLLGRYEDACSSLNLGPRGGPVATPGAALSYLPACNLLVRRGAFEAVGGFRPAMRLGEDVELCWRLQAAGHGLFYYPGSDVRHDHRRRWGAFLRRKRDYARSEAWLRRNSPERFAGTGRLLLRVALGVAAAGLAFQMPVVGAVAGGLVLLEGLAPLRRIRGAVAPWNPPTLLMGLGRRLSAVLLLEGRLLTRHTAVFWLPMLLPLPSLWPLAALVFSLGALGEWLAKKPSISPAAFLIAFGAECFAYSFGFAEGWVRERGVELGFRKGNFFSPSR